MQELSLIENKNFTGLTPAPARAEYENCHFRDCRFAEADLSRLVFSQCTFTSCDLSLAQLNKTAFRDITFTDCKMLGLRFDLCDDFLFSVGFENCNLNLCSFYGRKMKGTIFKSCSTREADFTLADLSTASFNNSDLNAAIFEQTTLQKTDFRSACNFIIDPEKNPVKGARFDLAGLPGLLDKYGINLR